MKESEPVVDFLIIGAQKCGTTTLFKLLSQHPDIASPTIKEPGFFLTYPYRTDPIDTLEKYHSLFDKKPGQLAFEATVDYSAHPHLIDQIWNDIYKYNPKMKIIYIVRNPVERMVSAHRFLYKKGIFGKKHRNINDYITSTDYHINLSRYFFQISPYIKKFGRDQVEIIFFKDLKNRPQMVMNDICSFLGIPKVHTYNDINVKSNTKDQLNLPRKFGKRNVKKLTRSIKKILPKEVYVGIQQILKPVLERKIIEHDLIINNDNLKRLSSTLIPDLISLEKITGRDLSNWKKDLEVK